MKKPSLFWPVFWTAVAGAASAAQAYDLYVHGYAEQRMFFIVVMAMIILVEWERHSTRMIEYYLRQEIGHYQAAVKHWRILAGL